MFLVTALTASLLMQGIDLVNEATTKHPEVAAHIVKVLQSQQNTELPELKSK